MRKLPEVEQVAGRQRVEVAGEDVKAVLMPGDACEKRAELDHAVSLGPRRIERAEMHAEDP